MKNAIGLVARGTRNPSRAARWMGERCALAANWAGEELVRTGTRASSAARKVLRPALLPLVPYLERLPAADRLLPKLVGDSGGPRRHLRRGLSRESFAAEMNARNIRYVLLRWWHDFPHLPAGEDMDILVEDDDLTRLADLLVDYPAGGPCDIYSARGSGRGHRRGVPYFPPALAAALLDGRRLHRGLVMVPGPRTHFAALAYHAVFHKGERSGLSGFGSDGNGLEHDYAEVVRGAARDAGLEVEVTVESLACWLNRAGFAPGQDTLTKLIDRRPELVILREPLSCDLRGGELCVFVVRSRAEDEGLADAFSKAITDRRIEILESVPFAPAQRTRIARRLRGGKWDKGPFPVSGGDPARLVVGYDYHPEPPTPEQARNNPWFTNRHVLEAKQACRRIIRQTRPFTRFYNGVHSADNEREAREYLAAALPEELPRLEAEVERRRRRYHTRHPVRSLLSEGQRAKVELIDYHGALAVKKTFRIGFERFLQRELLAARELAEELPFIPPLLEEGDGYLIVPHLDNILSLLSKSAARAVIQEKRRDIFGIICSMFQRGLAYIDFKPSHIMVTKDGKLSCVDFEFLQPYPVRPETVDSSYEVAGVPANFPGDLPAWAGRENRPFDTIWKPFVGPWHELKQQYMDEFVASSR